MASSSDFVMMDGHVHFHREFEAGPFLESAHANFRDAARRVTSDASFVGVLLLTEGQQENGFDRLVAKASQQEEERRGAAATWNVRNTAEPTSVRFTAENRAPILVVAGRQIPTRERLEVLAIGTRRQFEAGQPIETLIRKVARVNAVPVIPWGAGKWIGKRGQLIDEMMRNPRLPLFFLGDSANRPFFWPTPAQFRRAEEEKIKIISGSDPLPFPGEVRQVGSFGVMLNGSLNLEEPVRDLKKKLTEPSITLRQFGSKERPLRFVRNQLKMQFRKLTR